MASLLLGRGLTDSPDLPQNLPQHLGMARRVFGGSARKLPVPQCRALGCGRCEVANFRSSRFPRSGHSGGARHIGGSGCALWNPRDQAAHHRIADIAAIAISIGCEDDARRAMGVLFACWRIVVLVDLIALIAIPGDIPGMQTQQADCCVTADGLHPNFPPIISRVGQ
jgi:hypothetical protein